MNRRHRELIENNANELAKLINFDAILPFVRNKQMFTEPMLDDICGAGDENAVLLTFLLELQTRGPHAYAEFIIVLKSAGQNKAVRLMSESDPSDAAVCEPNPIQYLASETAPARTPISDLRIAETSDPKIGSKYYKMTSFPRGHCLLINNRIFDDERHNRDGSEVDVERLDAVFQQLGYVMFIHSNKTRAEMKLNIEEFALSFSKHNVDSCIVIVMSHGDKGVLFGTDYIPLKTSEIFQLFDNEKCKALIGKPKMFIIQACRGVDIDAGVNDYRDVPDSVQDIVTRNSFDRLPTTTDMVICNSTLEGYKSLRNTGTGSWYCEALAETLVEKAKDSDLQEILACVDDKVRNRTSYDGTKQATETTYKGFSKTFYFNPGYYE